MTDADDARRNLADMLREKGADDAGMATMLGLADDFAERVRAEDAARDDALGYLVYEALHDYAGSQDEWRRRPDEERAPYIAAAHAVEDRLEEELEALDATP